MITVLVPLALLAACVSHLEPDPVPAVGPVEDATAPTGSRSMVADAAGTRLYTVLPEEGRVARLDLASGEIQTVDVGGFPSRIARFGGGFVVSARHRRSLVLVEDRGAELVVTGRIDTGAEPVGLVGSRDGTRLYVALYGADEVREYDETFAEARRFVVGGRPSWLALHPSGDTLAVGSQVGGTVWTLDVTQDEPVAHALPVMSVLGGGNEGEFLEYSRRVTGDPSYSAAGDALVAPLLFVDNTAVPRHKTEEEALARDPAERYRRLGLSLAPNNPAIAHWSTDAAGVPDEDSVALIYATGNAAIDSLDTVQVVRSFLASAQFADEGDTVWAPMEGSRVVLGVSADPAHFVPAEDSLVRTGTTYIGTPAEGPRGIASLADGRLFAAHVIDRAIVELPGAEAQAALDAQASTGWAETSVQLATAAPVPLADPALTATEAYGERLFNSAIDPLITTPLAGVSCSTCHFESRNDGLPWMESDGIFRQTLALAGPLSTTAPFTWTNDVATVAEEVRITSQVRLGGRNATPAEYDAVAAFLEHTPDIDHPERGREDADAVRGRALFERADVGCAACHFGERYTDQSPHDLYGMEGVDTPSLIGVATSAPYLHDGSAPTLRALLEGAGAAGMGDTSGLDDAELADLEAYLRTL